jgi:hypothetical protein
LVDNLVFNSLRHNGTNLGKDFFYVKGRGGTHVARRRVPRVP